jgi:hypothetical protein
LWGDYREEVEFKATWGKVHVKEEDTSKRMELKKNGNSLYINHRLHYQQHFFFSFLKLPSRSFKNLMKY